MINIVSKEQPTPKIGTKEMEMKYSLHIQYAGTLSAKDVVAFACKHTGMQSTAMKAALDSCCQTIELFLSMGYRVQMGELGTFFATTNSTTVYSNVDAGLSQLKKLNVRFNATKDLKHAVNNAEKRLVAIQKLVDPEKKIYQTISTNELTDSSQGAGDSGENTGGGGTSGSGEWRFGGINLPKSSVGNDLPMLFFAFFHQFCYNKNFVFIAFSQKNDRSFSQK